jgi:hypothetical protein
VQGEFKAREEIHEKLKQLMDEQAQVCLILYKHMEEGRKGESVA